MTRFGGGFAKLARSVLRRNALSSLERVQNVETAKITEEMIRAGAEVVQARHGGGFETARLTAFHTFLRMVGRMK